MTSYFIHLYNTTLGTNHKFNKCSCEFTEYQWSHSDNNTIVIHKISSEFFHLIYIDGETVETVSDFIFEGSKITADSDCSHEIKRRLLLGRKAMTNLDSLLKSRDKSYGFSRSHVWM